jgi:hypothetical protein
VEQRIAVRRLYCPHAKRTVSLLPDFCIPRRQHGPAILALFLGLLVKGLALLKALRAVRAAAPCHALAQSLRDGFLKREAKIRVYLAGRRQRAAERPKDVPERCLTLGELFGGLTEGFGCPAAAFLSHTVDFHSQFADGLA